MPVSLGLRLLDLTSSIVSALAGGGCLLGSRRWSRLPPAQRWLTAFLGASFAAGVVGDVVRKLGHANAWVGNLWQAAIPGLLMPALIAGLPKAEHSIYRAVQRVLMLVWICYFLVYGHLGEFSLGFHACACIATSLLALTLMFRRCFVDNSLAKSPEFIAGVGAWLACATDVLPHAAYAGWAMRGESLLLILWVVRNAAWGLGYLLMAYAIWLGASRE